MGSRCWLRERGEMAEKKSLPVRVEEYAVQQRGYYESIVNTELPALGKDVHVIGQVLLRKFQSDFSDSLRFQFDGDDEECEKHDLWQLLSENEVDAKMRNLDAFVEEEYKLYFTDRTFNVRGTNVVLDAIGKLYTEVSKLSDRFNDLLSFVLNYVKLCSPRMSHGIESENMIQASAAENCFKRANAMATNLGGVWKIYRDILEHHHFTNKERKVYNPAAWRKELASLYRHVMVLFCQCCADLYAEINGVLMSLMINIDCWEFKKRKEFVPRKRRRTASAAGDYYE